MSDVFYVMAAFERGVQLIFDEDGNPMIDDLEAVETYLSHFEDIDGEEFAGAVGQIVPFEGNEFGFLFVLQDNTLLGDQTYDKRRKTLKSFAPFVMLDMGVQCSTEEDYDAVYLRHLDRGHEGAFIKENGRWNKYTPLGVYEAFQSEDEEVADEDE